MSNEQRDEITQKMLELSQLLEESGEPHLAIVVTSTNAQLLQGVFGVVNPHSTGIE